MTHETIEVIKALQAIGLKIVYIFNEYNKDGFYFSYTEFNYVDNIANKIDVKGKDITDIITKGNFIHGVNNQANFKDQAMTAINAIKDIRMEFSHHWKWINFIALY